MPLCRSLRNRSTTERSPPVDELATSVRCNLAESERLNAMEAGGQLPPSLQSSWLAAREGGGGASRGPPRFKQLDVELLRDFLLPKHHNALPLDRDFIGQVVLYGKDPGLDPSRLTSEDVGLVEANPGEWYAYTRMANKKIGLGTKTSRGAGPGVWETSTTRREVKDPRDGEVLGYKSVMKYMRQEEESEDSVAIAQSRKRRRNKNFVKTEWLMAEYRIPESDLALCKIYKNRSSQMQKAKPRPSSSARSLLTCSSSLTVSMSGLPHQQSNKLLCLRQAASSVDASSATSSSSSCLFQAAPAPTTYLGQQLPGFFVDGNTCFPLDEEEFNQMAGPELIPTLTAETDITSVASAAATLNPLLQQQQLFGNCIVGNLGDDHRLEDLDLLWAKELLVGNDEQCELVPAVPSSLSASGFVCPPQNPSAQMPCDHSFFGSAMEKHISGATTPPAVAIPTLNPQMLRPQTQVII